MPKGIKDENDQKNGHKGHQRANQQWHYVSKNMSREGLFMWKVIDL